MWTPSARLLAGPAALALALIAGAAPASADHPVEGTLQGVHADFFGAGSSATQWQLETGGGRTLDVLPTTLPALTSGSAAVAVDDEDPGAGVAGPVTSAAPQAAPALGARRTAVIAFNFADNPVQPWTIAQLRGRIFTGSDSTSSFLREESNGQLWLSGKAGNLDGDVYGWFTLPPATGCTAPYYPEPSAWATMAKAAAVAQGFDPAGYQHFVYVFPPYAACGWAGLAYMPGTESWINGDPSVRVTGHELSHNLGLHHAGSWFCTGASGQAVPISPNCTLNEYNDPFDVMGNWGSRHSSGYNLQRLGVLQPSNVQTVSSSGTYALSSALDPTTEPTTLRIPRSYAPGGAVQDWYYVEIREAGGAFESFPGALGSALTGVSIRVVDDPAATTRSRLIDTDAGGGIVDGPLDPGRTFSDGRISVRTVSAGAGAATVAIDMSAPPLDQAAPSAPTGLSHTLLDRGLRLAWVGSADDVGVSSYAVYRDGVPIGTAGANLFEDTTVVPGRHAYTVYAEDEAGNRSPASGAHLVTVPAARTASLKKRPADRRGPRLRLARKRLRGGRLLLSVRARDDAGVARVELRIDGRRVRARRASRVSYRWRVRAGRHSFVAVGYDRRGNRAVQRVNVRLPRA